MAELRPHPSNVPGDFYVEDGCCTMCEVPFIETTDLFGDCNSHCYVKRQPETPAELDQMVMAIRCAELKCIRYRGTDRLIQIRLVREDEGMICDGLPPDLQQEAERREARKELLWGRHQQPTQAPAGEQITARRPWWLFW